MSYLRRFSWVLGGVVILALILMGFVPQPVPVDLAQVTVGPLRVTVDQEGKTRVRDRYQIASPIGGQLVRVALRAGDEVKERSTVLAVIQPRESEFLDASARAQAKAKVKAAQSMREKAEANLQHMRVKVEYAQRERERLQRLAAQRGAAEQELDTATQTERAAREEQRGATQAVKAAEYDLEQARAVLQRADAVAEGEALEQFQVTSPIDGKVLRVDQESATVVNAGAKLMEVGDVRRLEVVIDVLSPDAVKIREDQRVILEHWGGSEPLTAKVRVVEPGGYTKISALGVEEQRVNVIADRIEGPGVERLADGYRVEARVVIREAANARKVPAGAMVRQGAGWAVFVVEGGKARLRPVTVGMTNGLETEILEGLREGDSVIVHAGDRVKDGVGVAPR